MLRLLCIIAIVFAIIVLNSGTIVRSESPPFCGYSNNKTSRCPGDHDRVEIMSPFWIGNRTADEAGDCTSYYPGFQVKCAANGRPVLNISNHLYYVLSISRIEYVGPDRYGSDRRLRVVDVDIDAQECPQPRRNISIDSPRFFSGSSGYTVNMTFFYNCSKYPERVVQHVPCLYNSSRGPSFAFPDDEISTHQFDWYGNCEDAVLLSNWKLDDPYQGTEDYTQLLKSGFSFNWYYPVNCGNCELSGGKCSANESLITTTTPIHCNCPHGTTRLDGICPGPYHESYYGEALAPAPAPAPSTSPAADSLAPDSPMYYRSFGNGIQFFMGYPSHSPRTFFFLRDGQQIDKLVEANKPEIQKKIVTIADSVTHSK